MHRLTTNFEEIFPRSHGNIEEQNKVMESSIIIINYFIIINTYYKYIIMHNKIIIFLINASSRNAIKKKMRK